MDKIIQNDCNESEIPSIFLYLIYCEDISEFSNIRFNKLKIPNEKKKRLYEIYELYHYFNIRKIFFSELYKSKINDKELYLLSHDIKPFHEFSNETINPLNTLKLN